MVIITSRLADCVSTEQLSTLIPILGMFLKKTCTTYIRFTVVTEVFTDDKRQGSCGGWGIKAVFMAKLYQYHVDRAAS